MEYIGTFIYTNELSFYIYVCSYQRGLRTSNIHFFFSRARREFLFWEMVIKGFFFREIAVFNFN